MHGSDKWGMTADEFSDRTRSDGRTVVGTLKNGTGHYCYVVNSAQEAVEASIGFDRETSLTDLAVSRPAGMGATICIRIPPYSIGAFELTPPNTRLISATVTDAAGN